MADSLADFDGATIYLDTMVLYTFVRAEPQVQPVLHDFFKGMEKGLFQAYTSILTFDELAYRLTLAGIRDRYRGSPLDHFRKAEFRIMSEVYPHVVPVLVALRRFPNLHVVDAAAADVDQMVDIMTNNMLRPRDALHVATMRKVNCKNVATNDAHFDQVPDLNRFEIPVP
jgi:predicted nucleic acid-binding protein